MHILPTLRLAAAAAAVCCLLSGAGVRQRAGTERLVVGDDGEAEVSVHVARRLAAEHLGVLAVHHALHHGQLRQQDQAVSFRRGRNETGPKQ